MKIIECVQRSPLWWSVRAGIPTASEFSRIITPAKGEASKQQDPYIDELLSEIYDKTHSREPDEKYVSGPMLDGIGREPEARNWYSFERSQDVVEVGFVLSDCERYGGSPDGLVGDDGLLELKCPILKTHIGYLREGGLPSEYKCQVHGLLAITGRAYCDFVSYSPVPQLRSLMVRVRPNEFTKKLHDEVLAFCDRLDNAKRKLESKSL